MLLYFLPVYKCLRTLGKTSAFTCQSSSESNKTFFEYHSWSVPKFIGSSRVTISYLNLEICMHNIRYVQRIKVSLRYHLPAQYLYLPLYVLSRLHCYMGYITARRNKCFSNTHIILRNKNLYLKMYFFGSIRTSFRLF